MSDEKNLATAAVHEGERLEDDFGPLAPPLVLSSSFKVTPDAVGFSAKDMTEDAPYFYSRWANPTLATLEAKLAALEGGEAAVVFASGMAAITGLLLSRLSAGDHLILPDVCYAAVAEFGSDSLPRFGIAVSAVDSSDPAAVAAALRPNTRHIHLETPCNPTLRLADVEAIAVIARKAGATLSVDSTIATPLGLQPLQLGADFVVHSLTKYICGHGDSLGGAVVGRQADMDRLRAEALIHYGGILGAFDAWLLARSLHSLPARMAQHEAGALKVAAFLEGHPRVDRVYYPGLESHPQADLARRQLKNTSSLMAFTAKDGPGLARRLAQKLEVFTYAVSLGKSKSILFYIPTEDILKSSFRVAPPNAEAYRAWAGDGIFRVSVGLEDPADLIADLDQALGGGIGAD